MIIPLLMTSSNLGEERHPRRGKRRRLQRVGEAPGGDDTKVFVMMTIMIILITIIIIMIINTRPKPPYGRQGLAGLRARIQSGGYILGRSQRLTLRLRRSARIG